MANKKETLDPRQALFLEYYLNPGSETFSNIYRSALKAGYSDEYAQNMRAKTLDWVSENVGDVTKDELVKKSKKVLNKSLDSEDLKLAQDTAKFIAKTDAEFSEKSETRVVLPKPLVDIEQLKIEN
jgi:phage terminase small subunit